MIEAARLFVKVGSDTREGEAGLTSFNDKLNASARNLTLIGGAMTAAITLPLIGVAKAALDSAAGFEQSMNILQQVAGATSGEMEGLQAEALRLGAVTSFSAGEAAKGMLELAKAGMSTEDVMASIGGVMNLAAAGGVSLAEAASLTAATLNAFHLEAAESARIADLLAATANASAADISDLGQGMQQAGFAFSMANQPVESLAASLAILTNVGLTGSDAGTALKNAFMRLMNPTKEATGVMKSLGISFYDARGNMKALPDIIDMLNSATAGLTNEQRDAALATIFLSDGMKAMIPLMDVGKDGFNEMVGAVSEAGAASDVANARMSGLTGGIEYLKGSVDSFLIGAALPFLDTLGGLARGAGDALSAFGALPQPVINATLAILGILAATGPIITGLGLLAGALSFLLGPVGLVIGAVALLGAAWVTDFAGIQGITATALGEVQAWFNSTATGAQTLATSVSTAFANTSFPSLAELWADFQAGDFETLAEKTKDTAFELMVNLDTELNITATAQGLRDKLVDAIKGLSGAIDDVDFAKGSTAFGSKINDLTATVNNLDLSGIDWAATFKRILLTPMGVAVGAIQWVIGNESLLGLVTAVKGALGEIQWGEMGLAFVGLSTAVFGALGKIFTDMGQDLGLDKLALPKIDIPWEQLTINTVGLLTSVTNGLNNINWMDVGAGVGRGLVLAVAAGVGAISWAAELAQTLKMQAIGLALSIGYELGTGLHGIKWGEALWGLDTALKEAVVGVLVGMFAGIVDELNKLLPDFFGFLGDDRHVTKGPDSILSQQKNLMATPFSWADYIPALTWDGFLDALSWLDFVSEISWGNYVFRLTWSSFVGDIDWDYFIPSIDWDDFISGINPFDNTSQSTDPYSPSDNTSYDPNQINTAGIATMVSSNGATEIHVHIGDVTIMGPLDEEEFARKIIAIIRRGLG